MKTLLDDWKGLKASVFPVGLSHQQEYDMYLAYHAGALCAINILLEAMNETTEAQGMKLIRDLLSEAGEAPRSVLKNVPRRPE